MNDSSVLATRLVPPRLGPRMLRRDRLVRRIVEGRTGRLTLITAGAGFGKTTLVADAVAAMEGSVAWLSCDAGTNTPASLGRHLGCPWQRCTVHFLRDMLGHVQKAQQQMVGAAIRQVFAAASRREAGVILTDVVERFQVAAPKVAGLRSMMPTSYGR